MKRRYWTPEQIALLAERYPHERAADVARALGRDVRSVYQKASELGLRKSEAFWRSDLSGRVQLGRQDERLRATQFRPGQAPWNKGKHFSAGGRSAQTRFQPGNRPHTWQPVGSYRLDKYGRLQRKVTDTGCPPRDWQPVHRLVWIAAHGPVPVGHVIAFKAGQGTAVLDDITLDRLECISRAELARRNHPRTRSPELARLVQLKAAITRQVNRIQKEKDHATDQHQ